MLAYEVGSLWRTPDEGEAFSGWITLPWPLPAGIGLKAILIPQPLRRSPKEKFILYLEMPLIEPSPVTWPANLNCKGELMNEFFGPARPPGRRTKVMLCGESGTGKTLSAMGFPKCAYIDNHGGAENYQAGYPEHLYLPKPGQIATCDYVTEAIKKLLQDPGDRLTVVVDDITTYNNQVDFKWNNRFFVRQEGGKGHHREYYSNQPNDYIHPKREKNAFIRRLLAMDQNVVINARMKKLYAGSTGSADFMKVLGTTYDGDQNLIYEFDYIFQLVQDDDGKRYAEIMGKQRVPIGGKLFPPRFEFEITKKGKSTFYEIFSKYAIISHFNTPPHAVADPVTETETVETAVALTGQSAVTVPGPGQVVAAESPVAAEPPQPVTATPPSTGKEGCVPILPEQLDKLVELKGKFSIGKEAWDEYLKDYAVSTARDLSQLQAGKFIDLLETQVPF